MKRGIVHVVDALYDLSMIVIMCNIHVQVKIATGWRTSPRTVVNTATFRVMLFVQLNPGPQAIKTSNF